MSKSSARTQTNFLAPHPLAVRLLAELGEKDRSVLEIGPGSGRNRKALRACGVRVASIEAGQRPASGALFDAVLSTHALLHGTPASTAANLESIHSWLKPGGRLYITLGSKRDARYGVGTRISPHVFAPAGGDEAGVPHVFWDEAEVRALLKAFTLLDLSQRQVDEIAGSWAHEREPLAAAFHWIVVAGKDR